jgi:leucyl/phenylalanyl-tRNA---protein transferase
MPVFRLRPDLIFPSPELASAEGVLAVGGDLSPERLLLAYRLGIFPWYGEDEPILWWSPDPRFVLLPPELNVSRSTRQLLKKGLFQITFDRRFREVIESCRKPRKDRNGTWIHKEMMEAYCELHHRGFAHSVEVWRDEELAGGLYGVSLGKCFFGESMFSKVSNASKIALIALTRRLESLGFILIDCQIYTEHLRGLGARMIPRSLFLRMLAGGLNQETLQGDWGQLDIFKADNASS